MKTKDMTLCAFFTILYSIGAKMVIPAGIIPLTLQTMMVILAGSILNRKQILTSYGVYLLMGLLGLPVFANGGGLSYVLQPSFGFLLSFPLAACFISTILHQYEVPSFIQRLPICFLGLGIIYIVGCTYMYAILNFYVGQTTNFSTVIAMGAIPFLMSDSISIVIGCFCGYRLIHISSIQRAMN